MATITVNIETERVFRDLDLNFAIHPIRKDINTHLNEFAVINSVKNLVLLNHYEKPFQPFFGGDLNNLLFELVDNDTAFEIEETVKEAVTRFEPRALVTNVIANLQPDANSISVTINFQVVNTEELVTLETTLTRLR